MSRLCRYPDEHRVRAGIGPLHARLAHAGAAPARALRGAPRHLLLLRQLPVHDYLVGLLFHILGGHSDLAFSANWCAYALVLSFSGGARVFSNLTAVKNIF